jgi:hypothetical protein
MCRTARRGSGDQSINIFVAPGNARNLETLLQISESRQIITTTGVPAHGKGIAVGVGVEQDRPHILIIWRRRRPKAANSTRAC